MEIESSYVNSQPSMAELISSDLQSPSHVLSSSTQFASVSCATNPASHNGVLVNSHSDLSRSQSFSPSKMSYLSTVSANSLGACQHQPLPSPLESKSVISGNDVNQFSADSLSQSSTPAIVSLAISNESDFNADTVVDDESLKEGQSDFAWIKEKKSTRKQHQGWYYYCCLYCPFH